GAACVPCTLTLSRVLASAAPASAVASAWAGALASATIRAVASGAWRKRERERDGALAVMAEFTGRRAGNGQASPGTMARRWETGAGGRRPFCARAGRDALQRSRRAQM